MRAEIDGSGLVGAAHIGPEEALASWAAREAEEVGSWSMQSQRRRDIVLSLEAEEARVSGGRLAGLRVRGMKAGARGGRAEAVVVLEVAGGSGPRR